MDDLYENAWGEPSKTNIIASSSSKGLWTTPRLPLSPPDEVDLAAPSWGTGVDTRWHEHSEGSPGFSWSNAEPDTAWGVSTDSESDTRTDSEPHTTETTEATERPTEDESQEVAEDEIPPGQSSPVNVDSPSPSPPPSPPPLDRQDTPVNETSPSDTRSSSPEGDAFGTFATPFDSTSKPFATDTTPELEPDAWGSPWGGAEGEDEEQKTTPVDEWEVARQQKARLDRKIPPEVLAGILAQCAEYCHEAWPDAKDDTAKPADPDWMSTWRDGMDSVEGLETLMQSIVPNLTLEPPVQFTETSIAKSMTTAVRLTKNLPSSKTSPMSHYLAARGSTAWENAVKERKVVEEDVVPVGWKMMEKQLASGMAEPAKNSKTGGIFSFWGRRQSRISSTQSSIDSPREQSPSGAVNSPTADASAGSQSARASQESVRSRSVAPAKDEKVASPLAETVSPTSSQPTSLYSEAPDLPADGSTATPPPQPQEPSAVSRFLNRFSRRQSSISVSSAHRSFALSSDDLEFLSDIVPSARDGDADGELNVKALTTMLKPEPLPPAIPPPPSAPPPRPSSAVSNKPAPPLSIPLLPMSSSPASKPPPPSQARDLDGLDFFGSFESSPISTDNNPSATAAEPVATLPPANLVVNGTSSTVRQPESLPPPQAKRSMSPRAVSPPSMFGSMVPTEKSKSKPFQFPPPPPPATLSRPHTPSLLVPPLSTAMNLPTSSLADGSELQRPRSMSRGPKVPLSFTIPPPSSASLLPSAPPTASSIMSTTSDVPLGELYPGSFVQDEPSKDSAPSFPGFTLPPPPPPSSRPFTPSHPPPSGPIAPLLAPPPASSKPAQPAKPFNLFDDDDDFADFQSSVPSGLAPAPAPLAAPSTQSKPPLQAPFPLIRPPQQSAPAPKLPFSLDPPPTQSKPASAMPFLPPPPGSRGTTVPTLPPPVTSSAFVDSGPSTSQSSDPFGSDFSSFLSSPSSALQPSSSKSAGFDSFGSARSLLTPRKSRHSGFEGEDSPASSAALRTPSPPRPISKSPRHQHQSISVARQGEKKVKASQHLHTLSLMERAAARPGRWPAPPSPLPQALAFPSLGPPPKEDFMADDSFGAFESDALSPSSSSPTASNPAPALFHTPASSQSFPALSQTSTGGSGYTAIRPSGTSSNNAAAGGLSASDLSFFEGL